MAADMPSVWGPIVRGIVRYVPFAALAVALLYLGVPRTVASIIRLPADAAITELRDGNTVPGEILQEALATSERANAWQETPDGWLNAALLRISIQVAAERRDAAEIEKAITETRRGLALEPANTLGWSDLTRYYLIQNNRVAAAISLKTSIITASFRPGLTFWRCSVGFSLLGLLGEDGKKLMIQQIRFAWAEQRWNLVDIAVRAQSIPLIRQALIDEPDELKELDAILANVKL
jgi:hypothetical protein